MREPTPFLVDTDYGLMNVRHSDILDPVSMLTDRESPGRPPWKVGDHVLVKVRRQVAQDYIAYDTFNVMELRTMPARIVAIESVQPARTQ